MTMKSYYKRYNSILTFFLPPDFIDFLVIFISKKSLTTCIFYQIIENSWLLSNNTIREQGRASDQGNEETYQETRAPQVVYIQLVYI